MIEPRVEHTKARIEVKVGDEVVFSDTTDHFDNGFVRLLGITSAEAEAFLVAAASDLVERGARGDDRLGVLAAAWESVATPPRLPGALPTAVGGIRFGTQTFDAEEVWAPAIGGDLDHCMVGSIDPAHAWLVDRSTMSPVVPDEGYYEEQYFEGALEGVGYGDYLEQAGWRLEKAARQVRQVRGLLDFLGVSRANGVLRLLDVGAGYGFFRQAAGEAGIEHEGTEISRHAANVARELFGFDTRLESLAEVAASTPGRFDAIVMWDFLEHVMDPVAVVADAHDALAPGGALFVRTPNLLADEHRVFGTSYHSLKLEHLHMFSPASLSLCFTEGGLVPRIILSESHLLRGFARLDVDHAAATLRGSDLLAVAQRPT
jgi:2-polyprenyl-3-methyl-5-hydroxy-6-metoxy-1,4-benzoquinol methylase